MSSFHILSVSRIENREYGFMRWYSQLMKLQHFNQIYPGLFAEVVAVGSTGVDAWRNGKIY